MVDYAILSATLIEYYALLAKIRKKKKKKKLTEERWRLKLRPRRWADDARMHEIVLFHPFAIIISS